MRSLRQIEVDLLQDEVTARAPLRPIKRRRPATRGIRLFVELGEISSAGWNGGSERGRRYQQPQIFSKFNETPVSTACVSRVCVTAFQVVEQVTRISGGIQVKARSKFPHRLPAGAVAIHLLKIAIGLCFAVREYRNGDIRKPRDPHLRLRDASNFVRSGPARSLVVTHDLSHPPFTHANAAG